MNRSREAGRLWNGQSTPASSEDVIAHFAETMGFEKAGNVEDRKAKAKAYGYLNLGGSNPSSRALIRDNPKPESDSFPPQLRSVRSECLIKRTRTYHVNVLISRADDDETSHIVVVFDPLL